jgi:short-subunit dehydrogenase
MTGSIDHAAFCSKYGPWAVITGASDGTGAAFARQLAALGLNLVLIARRKEPLSAIAAELEEEHGISTRTASIDLYQPGAGERVLAAAEGLEVGLYVSNAGADSNGSRFLDAPLEAWRNLVNRNVVTVVEAVYGFAGPMRQRGRGGLILMSSGTALGGQPGVAVYSSSKAFDLNFAESLWGELGSLGVDVIAGVCPPMDTPSFRRTMAKVGPMPPGVYEPDDIVRDLLTSLPDGPTRIFPFGPDAPAVPEIERARRARARVMIEAAKMFAPKENPQ